MRTRGRKSKPHIRFCYERWYCDGWKPLTGWCGAVGDSPREAYFRWTRLRD